MPAVELATGKELGPFKLDRRLALGGMAEIWLAEQRSNGVAKRVALKVLLPAYACDPNFRTMFDDEVRIASELKHENIVQVYGAFNIGGHLLQAMEIVDGQDLRRILIALGRAGERFPVSLALLVVREVARGLAYAHSKRGPDGGPMEIIHRDVSPHNVMITRSGEVKILDFGIAKATNRLTSTRVGVVKGKLPYMAPEQAAAQAVSPRTDVFALGIVLWEMLAMDRLFRPKVEPPAPEEIARVFKRVVNADVPPILERNPEVPEEAAALISHMLQQRAINRPESMRDVEQALTRILVKHFRDEEIRPEALAAWAARWLIAERPTTAVMAPPELPPLDADAQQRPTKSDVSGDRKDEIEERISSLQTDPDAEPSFDPRPHLGPTASLNVADFPPAATTVSDRAADPLVVFPSFAEEDDERSMPGESVLVPAMLKEAIVEQRTERVVPPGLEASSELSEIGEPRWVYPLFIAAGAAAIMLLVLLIVRR